MDYFLINTGILLARFENALMAIGVIVILTALVAVTGKLMRRSFVPMPILEVFLRPMTVFLIDRLNRLNRGTSSLIVRGMIVFVILTCVMFAIAFGLRTVASPMVADIILLVAVLAPLSSILIAAQLSQTKPYPRTYYYTAQTLNRNLIKIDVAGYRRHGFDLLALSLGEWFVAPIVLYVIGGIGLVYFYAALSLFCRVAGVRDRSTLFASLWGGLWTGLGFLPDIIASAAVCVAAAFTPKGKIVASLRVLFRRPILTCYAYGLGITLGGAYQDRHGQAVERPWMGAQKTSAKISHQDMLRGCYLHGVSVLLVIISMLALRLILY